MRAMTIAGLLGAMLLTAQTGAAAQAPTHAETVLTMADTQQLARLSRQKEAAEAKLVANMTDEAIAAALTGNLADKTKIIFQPGYGVYVEYTAADGRERMWFPGNTGMVTGHWSVQTINRGPQACFKYYNGIDRVTKAYAATDCIRPEQTLSGGDVIDEKTGDVFGLLSGQIPYRKTDLSVPAWPASGQ